MKFVKNIQNLVVTLMLLVFMLGSMPKTYLHNAIADHKDVISVCSHPDNTSPCIHRQDVNCHSDDLVVKTNYIATVHNPWIIIQRCFKIVLPGIYAFSYKPSWFSFQDYAGPPLLA